MIDLHCHILPGTDDGADSLRTALQETHAKTAAKAQAAKGKGMYSKDKTDSK